MQQFVFSNDKYSESEKKKKKKKMREKYYMIISTLCNNNVLGIYDDRSVVYLVAEDKGIPWLIIYTL